MERREKSEEGMNQAGCGHNKTGQSSQDAVDGWSKRKGHKEEGDEQ